MELLYGINDGNSLMKMIGSVDGKKVGFFIIIDISIKMGTSPIIDSSSDIVIFLQQINNMLRLQL